MKRKREGEEAAPTASASSSHDDGLRRGYEVFLNFRGPDTRLTIVDCLYNDLIREGIRAFKDDEELRFGENFEHGLLQAINNSRIYIPIFSKNYASSKWCLRELALIMELSRDNDEKVILPIFYDVDVEDVKLKTDLYKDAFQKHKEDSAEDLTKPWEDALRDVTRISGKKLKDYGLDELKSLTVKEVSSLLWTRQRDVSDCLVGIEDPVNDIMKMLNLEARDVQYIVIHGMGGIGKTILANVIFKQISSQFEDYYFLKDVRTNAISDLQQKLLSEIPKFRRTNHSDIEVFDMIKMRFHDKKVIIVLDDIDKRDQIMRLVGKPNWFGKGSRIIITTRNIEFLVKEGEDDNVLPSKSGQFSFYNMPLMNAHNALQLFCERALGSANPPPDYVDISNKLINTLGRLPLALDVVGSTLHGKCRDTWENVLHKLRKVMNEDVKKKLMISYEALEDRQQQIYLDIACFFINKTKTIAIKYWDAVFGYPTEIEVKILTRMSLIKIMDDDDLWMHDQLRDLGRDIVHLESYNIHQRGRRLWSPEDAFHIVQRKKGTENIVGLNLGTPEPDATYIFKRKEFARLVNLRFLQLDHGNFKGDFKDLFSELRWLSWSNCPSEFQATNFALKNLTVVMLSGNNITKDWEGWCYIMVAKQLKVLQLEDCPSLRKTPKFYAILQLERLILRCSQLRKIDKSIGNLQHLDYLEIKCEAIESLPKSIGNLKSLTWLRIMSHGILFLPHSIGNLKDLKHLILECLTLQKLPDSIGKLESLLELDVNESKISQLPHSIGNLERLKVLCVSCYGLEKLPDSIGRLQSLVKLNLESSRIMMLPECIGNLKKLKVLNLGGCYISEFPKTIGMLENLEELCVGYINLEREIPSEIPSEIGALSSLKILDLGGGRFRGLPTTINQLTNLQRLQLGECDSIQQLPKLPKSLTLLSLSSNSLTAIPDCLNLTNLVDLYLSVKSMQKPNIEGILRLPALRKMTLYLEETALPPTDFSSLSQLQHLKLGWVDLQSLIGLPSNLPSSLRKLELSFVQSPIDCSVFSNLENLSKLSICQYSLGEIRFDGLGELWKLNYLFMLGCPLLKTLPLLPGLKEIQCMWLQHFPQLTNIQGLGELKSLQKLLIESCNSIRSLDLSNLQNLKILELHWCKSLESVLGVPKSCKLTVTDCPKLNRDG